MTGLFPNVTIDFDLSDVERACDRAGRTLVLGARLGVQRGCEEGVKEAKARRRYKDRTGLLTATAAGLLVSATKTGAEGVMHWPQRYASFVDAGTKPHEIRARRAKVLAANGVIFGKRVKHPGTKPYGFAGVAYHTCETVMVREIELGVEAAEAAFR